MIMKTTTKISILIFSVMMIACGQPSLEKYYVDHQEKDNFIVMNIPSSMFMETDSKLSNEEKTTLKHVEKANILAFPLTKENKVTYEKEKAEVEEILKDEKYKLLMKIGGRDKQFKLMYLGDPNAIDEMIVYGSSDEAGFGVARILGDDMNPKAIIELVKSLGDKNLNIEGIENLKAMFDEQKNDSL